MFHIQSTHFILLFTILFSVAKMPKGTIPGTHLICPNLCTFAHAFPPPGIPFPILPFPTDEILYVFQFSIYKEFSGS